MTEDKVIQPKQNTCLESLKKSAHKWKLPSYVLTYILNVSLFLWNYTFWYLKCYLGDMYVLIYAFSAVVFTIKTQQKIAGREKI